MALTGQKKKAETTSWVLVRSGFKFLFDVPVHGVDDESFFANFEMGRLVDERCGLEATANKIYLIYIQIEPLIIIFRLASKLMIYLNQKQNY